MMAGMSITIVALILFAFALLGGGGLIVGAILAFKENKTLGAVLLTIGILVILCPIVLYALVLLGTQYM